MGKIYKCFVVRRITEAFYSLSQDEQRELLGKVGQALRDAGGETVVMVDLRWSGDGTQLFGVEAFPDLEAVQKHNKLLNDLNWSRYLEGDSYLGTEWQAM